MKNSYFVLKRSQEESRADDSVFDKRLGIYKKSHSEIINTLKRSRRNQHRCQ